MQQWLVALLLNNAIAAAGYFSPQKALTRAGVLHAWALGVVVWGSLGWRGYVVVAAYFLLGTVVTKLGFQQKEAKGIAEKRGGARGPENVWGSALTGAVCAVGYALFPDPLWWPAYVASFAAKLADTAGTEVGKAYGKRAFSIVSLRPVAPGTEGAMSVEGTLAGVVAAGILSGLALAVDAIPLEWLAPCWVAAILATTAESWMGATVEPLFAWLTHDVVNGIQTTLAAAIAVLLVWFLQAQGWT
jgi:uncharacterized protein (TIGR00297 family)